MSSVTAIYPPPGPGVALTDIPDLPPPPPPELGHFKRAAMRVPSWVAPLAVGAVAATACAYVGLVDPNQPSSSPFYPVCTFRQLTGFDCPGCGLTRALHALVTGDPLRAIDHNVFILALVPVAVYMYARWVIASTTGHQLPTVRVPRFLAYSLLPLVLAFWVVRNVPVGPLSFLASNAG